MIPSPYSKAQWKVRPKAPKMGVRPNNRVHDRHRQWVKNNHGCVVKGCQNRDIDPAHVNLPGIPYADRGGMGIKACDWAVVPLCRSHHVEFDNQINGGCETFQRKYNLDMVALAIAFASNSKFQEIRAKASTAMGR